MCNNNEVPWGKCKVGFMHAHVMQHKNENYWKSSFFFEKWLILSEVLLEIFIKIILSH